MNISTSKQTRVGRCSGSLGERISTPIVAGLEYRSRSLREPRSNRGVDVLKLRFIARRQVMQRKTRYDIQIFVSVSLAVLVGLWLAGLLVR